MTGSRFLARLKREGKLGLVDPSDPICQSYLLKSENCLRSARAVLREGLCENSVIDSYYAMYDSVVALLFRCGVKCENHTAAAMLLGILFDRSDLGEALGSAKKERVDKQYHVENVGSPIDEAEAAQMMRDAERFTQEVRAFITGLGNDRILAVRARFQAF